MSILTKKSILVTGGTGSIGTALVKKAIFDKAKLIRVFSNDENSLYEMESEYEKALKNVLCLMILADKKIEDNEIITVSNIYNNSSFFIL